jgi:hypothetical protein
VSQHVRDWLAFCGAVIDDSLPAPELFAKLQLTAIQSLKNYPLIFGLLGGEYFRLLPRQAIRLEALREQGKDNIERILLLGIRQGSLRSDLDAPRCAALLRDFALGHWILRPSSMNDGEFFHRALIGMEMVLQGLLPTQR